MQVLGAEARTRDTVATPEICPEWHSGSPLHLRVDCEIESLPSVMYGEVSQLLKMFVGVLTYFALDE